MIDDAQAPEPPVSNTDDVGHPGPKPPRERRPDYDRIRRFLKAGGVLQRSEVATPSGRSFVYWHAAARDGRSFHVLTCEWFKNLATFTLDGSEGWLEEGPPGIFKRVPDIHPPIGEGASYVNPDGAPAPEPEGPDQP